MTEATENLVLEHLKRIQSKLNEMALDILDIKLRQTATEQHLGQLSIQVGAINGRLDRLEERVARIERRLELADA